MKNLLVALLLIAGVKSVFAHDNFVLVTHEEPVCIYPSAFANRPCRIIQQIDELEELYTFKVLDDSLFRFKVQIYRADRCFSQDDDSLSVPGIGWIDKINTTVFIRATEQADGEVYIKLCETPSSDSKFIRVINDDHVDIVAYVDEISDNWYHINFIYGNKIYRGWTDKYCVNPYGCN